MDQRVPGGWKPSQEDLEALRKRYPEGEWDWSLGWPVSPEWRVSIFCHRCNAIFNWSLDDVRSGRVITCIGCEKDASWKIKLGGMRMWGDDYLVFPE